MKILEKDYTQKINVLFEIIFWEVSVYPNVSIKRKQRNSKQSDDMKWKGTRL